MAGPLSFSMKCQVTIRFLTWLLKGAQKTKASAVNFLYPIGQSLSLIQPRVSERGHTQGHFGGWELNTWRQMSGHHLSV